MSFTNTQKWLTAMSTNARSATKMMSQNTGIKILKRYAPTTGRVLKNQSASRRKLILREYGGLKMQDGAWLTPVSPEPYVVGPWFVIPVADAEQKRQSLITRITRSLLRSSGFASPATSSGTKS
jgi:hypothetical protein